MSQNRLSSFISQIGCHIATVYSSSSSQCKGIIEKIKKNPVWNKLSFYFRSSLIVQSLRILTVLLLLLIVLFFISPHRTYINLAIESDHPEVVKSTIEECTFSAESATITDFDELSISFFPCCTTQTYLDVTSGQAISVPLTTLFDSIIIGSETFDSSDLFKLVIIPQPGIDKSKAPKIEVLAKDLSKPIFKTSKKIENDEIKNVSCDSVLFSESSFTLNSIFHEFDIDYLHHETHKIGGLTQHLLTGGKIQVLINSCIVQLFEKGEIIRQYNDNNPVSITFPCVNSIHFAITGANCVFSHVKNLQCKISQLHNLSLFGNGHITVSYTPDSKDYELLKQPITIQAKDGSSLSAEIIQKKNEEFSLVKQRVDDSEEQLIDSEQDSEQFYYSISAVGFVNKIELAEISLLPDIFSWFRENVYLLPTTFVTIIIGSIQLIKERKEEKSNAKKTDD